jgi:hypothetical protein
MGLQLPQTAQTCLRKAYDTMLSLETKTYRYSRIRARHSQSKTLFDLKAAKKKGGRIS